MGDLTAREARAMLVDALRRHLVGPFSQDEVIQDEDKVEYKYHIGILYPRDNEHIDPEEDDDGNLSGNELSDEDSGDSDVLVLSNIKSQSAMGMTFQVKRSDIPITVCARWGRYERIPLEDGETDRYGWRRHQVEITTMLPNSLPVGSHTLGEEDGGQVRAFIRLVRGVYIVTVSLLNVGPDGNERDGEIDKNLYQAELIVEAVDGQAIFTTQPIRPGTADPEFWTLELQYRDIRPFAVGHGCTVRWDDDGRLGTRIQTEWIPEVEVFKASADVLSETELLDLRQFSGTAECRGACDMLRGIPDAYGAWIAGQEAALDAVFQGFEQEARLNIAEAAKRIIEENRAVQKRIGQGITFLESDDKAWQAFSLTNSVMATVMLRARPEKPPKWRIFQLAFLLMAIPSVANPDHPDRDIFDLIWFPTGGGKTEAYLGLSVFAMVYRRLTSPSRQSGYGLSILTRYTLRLLTIQQFERAARVVCALELVRRSNQSLLGSEEFSIGLFVGGGATPNSLKEAEKLFKDPSGSDGLTTLPLQRCPWCRTPLALKDQRLQPGRLLTVCPEPTCEFHNGIPVKFVDEEIYLHPPSMIVATIDKFARMAWEPRMRNLFQPGPDLIIQDELHLIGDALGTVAALYETAIDYLCSRSGLKPKVIGSTATAKRAGQQVEGLFARNIQQFPVGGLSAADSFFYQENRTVPGRLYVGIHAQGRSTKHTLAQLTGILTQKATTIKDLEIRDQFWTLVMYFNSLRELGGALVLVEDDVRRFVDALPPEERGYDRDLNTEELTSHVPSEKIPTILEEMARRIPELQTDGETMAPIDVVLATNMISVGVDIDRLGLMVIMGQPKTTAEYIQASSRVGRPSGSAGLVVTLYNWMRPRDRSHYERFGHYHRAIYRYVESTSVTPFSARARDKALHAVLVSLSRMIFDEVAPNESAGAILQDHLREDIHQLVMDIIRARVERVDSPETDETLVELNERMAEWVDNAASGSLVWRKIPRNKAFAMLRSPELPDNPQYGVWPTMQSMRDVEASAPVRLLTHNQLKKIQSNLGDE